MPIHDWTKVDAGIFHDFTLSWFAKLSLHLNTGGLPSTHYSLVESYHSFEILGVPRELPPQALLVSYAARQRTITIRNANEDRLIALMEIITPANKTDRQALRRLAAKAKTALENGIHLLLIDLFPPTPRDPQGIHGLIWGDAAIAPPADQPLTLVAYEASQPRSAYVEPTAVGTALIDMPLFLDAEHYVPVPLEATYQAAWRGVPQRWKAGLDAL